MQREALSEVGSTGYVIHGCSKQSRRRRGSEPETKPIVWRLPMNLKEEVEEEKPVASSIYESKMERGFHESLNSKNSFFFSSWVGNS